MIEYAIQLIMLFRHCLKEQIHEGRKVLGGLLLSLQQARSITRSASCFAKQNPSLKSGSIGSDISFLQLREVLDRLEKQTEQVNIADYASVIQDCCSLKALAEGKRAHLRIIQRKLESHTFLSNLLISMYGKCGSPEEAWKVFEGLVDRDVVSWNAMISAYARNNKSSLALKLFWQMQKEGVNPNAITFVSVLSACDKPESLVDGKTIHSRIVSCGILPDTNLTMALLRMYGKCGDIPHALEVFHSLADRNVQLWSALIKVLYENGQGKRAIELFWQMQKDGMKVDKACIVSVLSACSSCLALKEGKQIHAYIVDRGWEEDAIVGTAVCQMYSKCGSLEDARTVFNKIAEKDVITWTAMITTCTHHGDNKSAMQFFKEMQRTGVKPNKVTYISILNACNTPSALQQGKLIHFEIVDKGLESDVVVATALLQMYAKCGSLEDSWKVFNAMPSRNVVTWNALITANLHCGEGRVALSLFKQMQNVGARPDKVTFVSVLDACAILGFLAEGKRIHSQIIEVGLEPDVMVGTALISMYGKCGTFEEAWLMFEKVSKRDAVCWTSIIATCAQHGHDVEVLQLFGQMQSNGMSPDEVAFLGVLSACSHAGFLGEGWHYFHSMKTTANIVPLAEHYGCMVDLYGRAGLLDEAQALVFTLPFKANAVVWMSFLAACRMHEDVERGRLAAEHILEMEPQRSSPYVVLSNTYAATGKWGNVTKVRKAMVDRSVKKEPGCSWIEVSDKVHEFMVGDTSHLETSGIYAELERLNMEMKKVGYVPDTNLVLHDVDEEDKIDLLSVHSEKLAISFGLLKLPGHTPIRIIKNLRVCRDCHTVMKFISKIVDREIVVRDSLRFHHFKDGICSCGDYW